jgi:predicted TIM-barrel fold metal-dependent hydrolase
MIDPHVHFFELNKGKYDWLKHGNEPHWLDKHIINRDFSLDDLALNDDFELCGLVHIEAGFDNKQPQREIAWLESSMKLKSKPSKKFAFCSIGFIDITLEHKVFISQLNLFNQYSSFRGLRYILDEQVFSVLSQKNTLKNIAVIEERDLIFELHFNATSTLDANQVVSVFKDFKRLKLVLNHAGFIHQFEHEGKTDKSISAIAKLDNLHIKLSGFEMTDRQYQCKTMSDTITQFAECFDVNRLMLASNFPLTLFSKLYCDYWIDALAACKSSDLDFDQIAFKTARDFYQIDVENIA